MQPMKRLSRELRLPAMRAQINAHGNVRRTGHCTFRNSYRPINRGTSRFRAHSDVTSGIKPLVRFLNEDLDGRLAVAFTSAHGRAAENPRGAFRSTEQRRKKAHHDIKLASAAEIHNRIPLITELSMEPDAIHTLQNITHLSLAFDRKSWTRHSWSSDFQSVIITATIVINDARRGDARKSAPHNKSREKHDARRIAADPVRFSAARRNFYEIEPHWSRLSCLTEVEKERERYCVNAFHVGSPR